MTPIVELYMQGMSRQEIAEQCGLTLSGVCKHLRRRGITKRAERLVRRPLPDELFDMPFPLRPVPDPPALEPMLDLYTQGMTRNELAAMFGITPSGVGMYLRRRGITKRAEMELYAKVRAKGARVSDLFDPDL